MPAARHDIRIEQGATFLLSIVWRDSAGIPLNLSGYTARMQGRVTVESGSTVFSLTTGGGGVILGAQGQVTVSMDPTATGALAILKGVYDLELEDGAGVVTRLLEGVFRVSQQVTR